MSTLIGAILGGLTAYYCMNFCSRRRARRSYTKTPVIDPDVHFVRSRSGSFDAGDGDWSVLEKGVERGLFSPREKVNTQGYARVNRVGLGLGQHGHEEDVQGTPKSFGPYTHEPSINVSTSPSKSWLSRAISSRHKSSLAPPTKCQLSDPSRAQNVPSPSVYAPTQYGKTPLPPGAQAPYTPYSLGILSENEEDEYQDIGSAETMRRTKSLRRGLIEKLGFISNPRSSEQTKEGWTEVSLDETEKEKAHEKEGNLSPTMDMSGLRRNKSAGTPTPSHTRANSNVTVSPLSPKKKRVPMTYSPGTMKSPVPGQPSLTGDPIRPLGSNFKSRLARAGEPKETEIEKDREERKGWGQSWKKGGLADTMRRIAVEKASMIVSSASSAFISSSAPASTDVNVDGDDALPSPTKARGESVFKEEFSPLLPPPPVLRANEPPKRTEVLPRLPASVQSPPLENALTFTTPTPNAGTLRTEMSNARRSMGSEKQGVLPRTCGPRPISRLNSTHTSSISSGPMSSRRSGAYSSTSGSGAGSGSSASHTPSTATATSYASKKPVRPTSPKARYDARRKALEEVDEILKSSWSARSLSEMAHSSSNHALNGNPARGGGGGLRVMNVVDSPTGFGARIV